MSKFTSLKGQLLIAMPSIQGDDFSHSVVFVCEHNAQGAMGLVVNKPLPNMYFSDLVDKLDVTPSGNLVDNDILLRPVLNGGPVKRYQGFVLHSAEYFIENESIAISDLFALTANVAILQDIARAEGPKSHLITLGYAGWTAGQLENEIMRNGWLNCDADTELVFDQQHTKMHETALQKIGVDFRMLSGQAGHA